MKALTATPSGKEALAKAACVAFGLRVDLASLIHSRVGQTDDDPADHPQHARRLGRAHPAEIFLQRHIQAVMEPAFNDPVAALEPEQPFGLQLLQGVARDQIDGLVTRLPVTKHPRVQARHHLRSRKVHLAGRHGQAVQAADLHSSAVVLLPDDLRARTGARGKKPVL